MNKKMKWGALALVFGGAIAFTGYQLSGNDNAPGARGSTGLKEDFFLTVTHQVDTVDKRRLEVTALAYCGTMTSQDFASYQENCSADVRRKLDFHATRRSNFEAGIANANPEIRPNALFTEEMLRRRLLIGLPSNLYTVTAIKTLETPRA